MPVRSLSVKGARWARPVHGSRRSRGLLHPRPVSIVGISVPRDGGNPVFCVVGGLVAEVVLGDVARRIVPQPEAKKLVLGVGASGAQPFGAAVTRHARGRCDIRQISPGIHGIALSPTVRGACVDGVGLRDSIQRVIDISGTASAVNVVENLTDVAVVAGRIGVEVAGGDGNAKMCSLAAI